ncbi:MAG: PIG-L family deacetylase [Candidatus Magasanikbacteria bacterium]|nr:PIG-L family deacetylase [Candidatus Magasanikbacteria bacterium]
MRTLGLLTMGILAIVFFTFIFLFSFKDDTFVSKRKIVVAVLPHQDDELFMAGFLARSAIEGQEVYAVVVTDGSRSSARYIINGTDGHGTDIVCPVHKQVHHPGEEGYSELSHQDFVAARNREFLDSAKKLGISEDHVLFLNPGGVAGSLEPYYSDGDLDEKQARLVFEDLREKLGDGVYVTVSGGHPDHVALANGLVKANNISDKRWFPLTPSVNDISVALNSEELKLKREALRVYDVWDPSQDRFAVGRHSVSDLLDTWYDTDREYYTIESP